MVILHSMEDLCVFSYSNHFLGFHEVLRKQDVYGGTFPIAQVLGDLEFGQVWLQYVCHDITPQLWQRWKVNEAFRGIAVMKM